MDVFAATDRDAWRVALDPAVERRVVGAIDELAQFPVLDGTVLRVLELCDDADASTAEIVVALERDATFSANLLRYANSAALARPIRARTVRQAVMLVGRRALRRLCLETATYRFLERAPGNGRTVRGQLHLHAISVAVTASAAAESGRLGGEGAHLAGLLHDVGKLVLPLAFGDEAVDAIATRHPSGAARAELEGEELGIDHALAGALLAERWGCPPEICEAIALHHGGAIGLAAPTSEAACVQLANAVADMLAGADPEPALVEQALDRLGLDDGTLDALAEHAAVALGQAPTGRLGEQVADAAGSIATDDLTGLASRRHWLKYVHAALQEAGRGAIVVCAVRGLAGVTRKHGYGAANLVLTEVARIVSRHGRAGRIGGVVLGLWIEEGAEGARQAAARIREEVAAAVRTEDGPPIELSLAVAGAPEDGEDFASLLEVADRAIARDADDGRGAVAAPEHRAA
jgi:putative nucleotidyltransferase with HDIG domain